jgi:hypothetical protein
MTEPKDLLLVNEQLGRSNRFWKAEGADAGCVRRVDPRRAFQLCHCGEATQAGRGRDAGCERSPGKCCRHLSQVPPVGLEPTTR